MEYAAPLFIGINKNMAEKLELLQRRAHRIICGVPCTSGCVLPNLSDRRMTLARRFFYDITKNNDHVMKSLLPRVAERSGRFAVPYIKSSKYRNTFIPKMVIDWLGVVVE